MIWHAVPSARHLLEGFASMNTIRYVFTIVTEPQEVPENPLAQRAWIQDVLEALHKAMPVAQIGVVGVPTNEEELSDSRGAN